jgi:hypothetical protein
VSTMFGGVGLRTPHPERCLLCDQDDETIDHLLVSCVFARKFGLHLMSPQPDDYSFVPWCERLNETANDML